MTNEADSSLIALLDRVAIGDERAFRSLYERTCAKLYGLALRIVVQPEWADDALQEAYVQIWEQAAHYRSTLSPPLAWMGLIVRSRCLDQLRRRKATQETLQVDIEDEATEALHDFRPTPESQGLHSQYAQALQRCLSQLDGRQRQAITLAYWRDLSHQELARQLRAPLGTVKTWVRRGLQQLRQCMAPFVQ